MDAPRTTTHNNCFVYRAYAQQRTRYIFCAIWTFHSGVTLCIMHPQFSSLRLFTLGQNEKLFFFSYFFPPSHYSSWYFFFFLHPLITQVHMAMQFPGYIRYTAGRTHHISFISLRKHVVRCGEPKVSYHVFPLKFICTVGGNDGEQRFNPYRPNVFPFSWWQRNNHQPSIV
jgi:hypothetical protein